MKYKKHYLSEEGKFNKQCPLQSGICQCDSYCAWFDHEWEDCKLIGSLIDIKYELRFLNEDKKGVRTERRTFKF